MPADDFDRTTHPKLLAVEGSNVRPSRLLLIDEVYTIGRWEQCQFIVAPDDLAVSRLHAKIERDGPRYLLYDLSVNGTWVREQRVDKQTPHVLKDGDTIGLARPAPVLLFVDPLTTHVATSQLTYDERTMSFVLNSRPLSLTKNQLALLLHLYRNSGQVCTRESCGEAIWGEFDNDLDADRLERTVATVRSAMRAHLGQDPDGAARAEELIQVRRGIGYQLIP